MLYSIYSVSQVWEENLGFWRQENTEADSEGSELMQLILFLQTEELHVTFEMFRPACVTNMQVFCTALLPVADPFSLPLYHLVSTLQGIPGQD